MANEITLTAIMKLVNGNLTEDQRLSGKQFTQDVAEVDKFTQNIGTSEEDVTFSSVTTHGWLLMINLDATNYVEWGDKDTTMKAIGRLEPTEFAFFRMAPGGVMRMQANTAACDVLFVMLGD